MIALVVITVIVVGLGILVAWLSDNDPPDDDSPQPIPGYAVTPSMN